MIRYAAFFVVLLAVLIAPAAVSLSLTAAFFAVVLPQGVVLNRQRRQGGSHKAFSSWATKFSLILLMLVVSLRVLAEMNLLAAPYFMLGSVAGVLFNIVLLAQWSRRQEVRG